MSHERAVVNRLLEHLGIARQAPSLDYLHEIVRTHQLRVPFETLTKLIDYEPGVQRGNFLPSMTEYVDRIVTRRAGGLCWTLAVGLHVLLQDLGFEASLIYMDPGHCCVRVDLPEGPYYADVGYAAPLFRAYPLFESFTVESPRERFEYDVRSDGIWVTRQPGPLKVLDPAPRRLDHLRPRIAAANDWSVPDSFLRRLSYSGYVDEVFTSLRDGTLTRYLPGGPEKTAVAEPDMPVVLADVFGADPLLYLEAADVHRRFIHM